MGDYIWAIILGGVSFAITTTFLVLFLVLAHKTVSYKIKGHLIQVKMGVFNQKLFVDGRLVDTARLVFRWHRANLKCGIAGTTVHVVVRFGFLRPVATIFADSQVVEL